MMVQGVGSQDADTAIHAVMLPKSPILSQSSVPISIPAVMQDLQVDHKIPPSTPLEAPVVAVDQWVEVGDPVCLNDLTELMIEAIVMTKAYATTEIPMSSKDIPDMYADFTDVFNTKEEIESITELTPPLGI